LKREWREITTDRGSRAWTWRERLYRYAGPNARERQGTASAIDDLLVHLEERPDRRPSERHRSERRDRRVHVSPGQTLAAQYGHSAGSGEGKDKRARHDPVGEAHFVERVDSDDDATDPFAQA
jgi:hypothetical protein